MIAFNRQLNGIEAYLKANRDHGSRPLLERRQFCLQSGQQPAQSCFIWEHDRTTRLRFLRVNWGHSL